jgi:hypothetical protein
LGCEWRRFESYFSVEDSPRGGIIAHTGNQKSLRPPVCDESCVHFEDTGTWQEQAGQRIRMNKCLLPKANLFPIALIVCFGLGFAHCPRCHIRCHCRHNIFRLLLRPTCSCRNGSTKVRSEHFCTILFGRRIGGASSQDPLDVSTALRCSSSVKTQFSP